MLLVDNLILIIIAVSVLIGLFRGFVPEVMSIVVWVAAAFLAWQYSDFVAMRLQEHVDSEVLAIWLARALTFAGVLIAGGILTAAVSLLVEKTGLSGTDRMLGMAFGFARGVLIVGVLVLFARALGFAEEAWWDESTLLPYGERVAGLMLSALPSDVGDRLPEFIQQVEGAARGLENGNGQPPVAPADEADNP